MTTSSVVLVGDNFVRQLFDDPDIFPGLAMRTDTIAGPYGSFIYGANEYRFDVMPDRIVLQNESDDILSDNLMDAAGRVAAILTAKKMGHGVSGLGYNFETILPQSDAGATGEEFCKSICKTDRLLQSVGMPFHNILYQVIILRGGIQYLLRIEPHLASRGANLFFSANGHQGIQATDDLRPKLDNIGGTRAIFEEMRTNLSREFAGELK